MKKENPFDALFLNKQLCFPLYAASRLTTKVYGPYLKELGITYPQYLVMLVLWEDEKQTVNQIGQRLFLESNTLTPLLKRLEQHGLLERNRSKEDERTVIVSLTQKGEDLKLKAQHIPTSIIKSFENDRITEKEIYQLQNTLNKLVRTLEENLK